MWCILTCCLNFHQARFCRLFIWGLKVSVSCMRGIRDTVAKIWSEKVYKMSEVTMFTSESVVSVLKRSTLQEVATSRLLVHVLEEWFNLRRSLQILYHRSAGEKQSGCKWPVKAALCPTSLLEILQSCIYFELEVEKGFLASLAYAFLRNTFSSSVVIFSVIWQEKN